MFLRNIKVFFENIKVFFGLSRFLAGIIFYTREVLLTSHYEKRLFEHASQPRVACQILAYIIHSGFISGYQNRYGDNLKPPTNVYHRMTA